MALDWLLWLMLFDQRHRKHMSLRVQQRRVGSGPSPPHLRLFVWIAVCQRPPSLMFSWQCFSCDLKPFWPRERFLTPTLNLRTCVLSLCSLLSEEVTNSSSLPSLIWPTSASHPPQCFGVSLPFFFSPPPFPLSVGFLCDMKQAVSDSLSVSEWTAWARKLQCHTRGYWRRVLWHLSRERELCLRGGYCSLQAEAPCLWTHNMRVVSKVHSLHPITACTPSHFSVLAFNLLLIVGARAYHNALYKSYFLYLGWDENQHWLWRLAYGCLLLPILK